MKHLSKSELMTAFLQEVQTEQITITNVVNYIREIDSRRLYLDFKCTSLFQFLIEHAKYSKSAAQRRIDAARLVNQIPQVAEDLKSGDLNITQASQISRLVREKEKLGKVDLQTKEELVEAVKNKSTGETEQILCQILEIAPKQQERAKLQADESTRREATFTKEQEAILHRVKDLMSHKNPNPSFADLVMEMANVSLKEFDPLEKPSTAPAPKTANARYIPRRTRTHVHQKLKCCQHLHEDGTKCSSRFKLEVDHIIPVHQGGTNDPKNLQLLCDQHNRQKYRNGA